MQYYYGLFLFSIVLGLFLFQKNYSFCNIEYVFSDQKKKRIYVTVVFFQVFLLVGFRSVLVGIDTENYSELVFNNVMNNGMFVETTEPIINIIAGVSQIFSNEYQLFLVFYSGIVSLLFAKYIYHNSEDVFMSTVIFLGMFFVQSMNLMREWLAIGLGINAYTLYRRKQYKKGLILYFLSVLSHNSSICLIIMLLIEKNKNKKKGFILVAITSMLFFTLRNSISDIVVSLFPKYNDYVYNSFFLNEGGINIKDIFFILIELYLLYVIMFKNKRNTESSSDRYYEYASFLLLAIVLSLCGQRISAFHRVVYYYSVFLIIAIPELYQNSKFKMEIKMAFCIAMFIMLYRNSFSDNNGISNYMFFWE